MPEGMLGAMPDAYTNALPTAVPVTQCTDGRTDGQDGEPPHLRDHLPLCDARDADGEISSRMVWRLDRTDAEPEFFDTQEAADRRLWRLQMAGFKGGAVVWEQGDLEVAR